MWSLTNRLRGALFLATSRQHHIRLSRVPLNLETIVGDYIRGQLITCVFMGIFMFVLLTACGITKAEYQRRTKGMPTEQAAAVAVEISQARKKIEEQTEEK